MLVYDLLNIRHSAVADFDGVAVEDLSERVVCCEYIVNYLKELSAYVCQFLKRLNMLKGFSLAEMIRDLLIAVTKFVFSHST